MENTQGVIRYDLGEQWLARELQHVKCGDERIRKRLFQTVNLLDEKISGSINQSCGTWKEAKGGYRLFSNAKLKVSEIYASHYQGTVERIKEHQLIFSLQDTTYLDFDTHTKTVGLGSISKAYTKHKKGLIMHSALAVTMEGLPLGLTSQQCWSRPAREEAANEKSRRRYLTAIEDKESHKWITALKNTIQIAPAGTKVVTIGDREADIFAFLWVAASMNTLFVVRNRQNRKFIVPNIGKTDLRSHIKQLSTKREIVLEVPRKDNNKARKAKIEVKYASGLIPIRSASIYGSKKSSHKISDKIAVHIVSAQEIHPPQNVEPIDWLLITNLAVHNFEDAIERIKWYKLRWKIEEYFRILKSGCKIENSRLSTKERLEKLIAIKSIIAFKILYLSKVVLSYPEEVCTRILSHEEWKALYIREHQAILLPDKPPTIKQVIIWLGKLGGFMNRKNDKFPGTMTLWRGYENLKQSIIMIRAMETKSCG